jgi:hypothetical protein
MKLDVLRLPLSPDGAGRHDQGRSRTVAGAGYVGGGDEIQVLPVAATA